MENALSSLKEREAKILRLYFGLDDQQPMTLEEIGALMGITRERVRQIKQKALIRLRHASLGSFSGDFLLEGCWKTYQDAGSLGRKPVKILVLSPVDTPKRLHYRSLLCSRFLSG